MKRIVKKKLEDLKIKFNVNECLTFFIKTRNFIINIITYLIDIIKTLLSFK